MNTNLGNDQPPAAGRTGSPGWRDPRLWIGVALVAASVIVGVRVFSGADDTIAVWSARTDLARGQQISHEDLVERRVAFADGEDRGRYLPVGEGLPDESTLTRAVGSGELVPREALGEQEAGVVNMPFFLPAVQVPPELAPGSTIDIYVTPPRGSSDRVQTGKPVMQDVVVLSAPDPAGAFGPDTDRQIVVGVAEDSVDSIAAVLAAAKDHRLAIIRDPAA